MLNRLTLLAAAAVLAASIAGPAFAQTSSSDANAMGHATMSSESAMKHHDSMGHEGAMNHTEAGGAMAHDTMSPRSIDHGAMLPSQGQ